LDQSVSKNQKHSSDNTVGKGLFSNFAQMVSQNMISPVKQLRQVTAITNSPVEGIQGRFSS
jgi:hypothetical protein